MAREVNGESLPMETLLAWCVLSVFVPYIKYTMNEMNPKITQYINKCMLTASNTRPIDIVYCETVMSLTVYSLLSSSYSSDTVQGSVLLPHYRTLEVRPGRIS